MVKKGVNKKEMKNPQMHCPNPNCVDDNCHGECIVVAMPTDDCPVNSEEEYPYCEDS